jgi:hypothetical protein
VNAVAPVCKEVSIGSPIQVLLIERIAAIDPAHDIDATVALHGSGGPPSGTHRATARRPRAD